MCQVAEIYSISFQQNYQLVRLKCPTQRHWNASSWKVSIRRDLRSHPIQLSHESQRDKGTCPTLPSSLASEPGLESWMGLRTTCLRVGSVAFKIDIDVTARSEHRSTSETCDSFHYSKLPHEATMKGKLWNPSSQRLTSPWGANL